VGRPVSRVSGQSFFTLDTDLFDEASLPMPATNDVVGRHSDVEPEVDTGPSDDGDEQQSGGGQSLSSVAARCREHLCWLVDATYTCTDRDALFGLEQTLGHGCNSMQLALLQDAGIVLYANIPTRTQVGKHFHYNSMHKNLSSRTKSYIEPTYVNRKGIHTVNVQAICDHNKRLT